MAPKDLDKLIEKYLEGKCTKEESEFIDSLYSRLGKNPDRFSAEFIEEKISSAEIRILNKLEAHARSSDGDEFPVGGRRYFFWQYTGIAASVVFILAAAFYFLPYRPSDVARTQNPVAPEFLSVENTSAVTRRVILADGSFVEMSPSAKIRYSNNAQSPSREVFLEGEASFDVAHDQDRPFYVYAGNVVTKVLGTSFIVRAIGRDEKVTVSVKTGKVTVYSKNAAHKKTVLLPHEEAVYDQRTDVVATQPVPAQKLIEQKSKFTEMRFEETPVPEVLAMLTRTYDIDIIFEAEKLSGCVLTSSFFEEGLYDRIDVICTAIGATYKIVDARIVIESNGCNLKPN